MKKGTVIAVDFDGTLSKSAWPQVGKPRWMLIRRLKWLQEHRDVKLILWTCREGMLQRMAVESCENWGLRLDGVNENLPERRKQYGNDCRKVSADIYLDDKGRRWV